MNGNFADRLLSWYELNGRELPWRGTTDPYRIWISEVILQQTRVAQGYDYYVRFIHRFPTVASLASAGMDEVMRYWQGLGYYSRARNLHVAAQQVMEKGGDFPHTYEEIRALKGIGDYTAAAIASFAYGEPKAVVDGNVYRVLARYFGMDTPIDSGRGKKEFGELAQELLPKEMSARYNQAIMDFGALQCTPKRPSCDTCPLRNSCLAYATDRCVQLPVKQHRTRVRDRYFAYVYVRCGDSILLRQRKAGDIWEGLYEVPLVESEKEIGFQQLEAEEWICAPMTILAKDLRHQLSHQLLHVDFYLMDCRNRPELEGIWIKESDRDAYAVSRLMANLFALSDASS